MKILLIGLCLYLFVLPFRSLEASVRLQISFREWIAEEGKDPIQSEKVLKLGALQRASYHSSQAPILFGPSKELFSFLDSTNKFMGKPEGSELENILPYAMDRRPDSSDLIELRAEKGGCFIESYRSNREDPKLISLYHAIAAAQRSNAQTVLTCIEVESTGNVVSLPEIPEKKISAGHYMGTSGFVIETDFEAKP
jgi:hypothetical protein